MHPDDIFIIDSSKPLIAEMKPISQEIRLKSIDGNFKWHLYDRVAIRDANQNVVKWVGMATDIDKQKRAADSQRFLANLAPILDSSLADKSMFDRATDLVAQEFKGWCILSKYENGSLVELALKLQNPLEAEKLKLLQGKTALSNRIIESREPIFTTREGVGERIGLLGAHSYIGIPMISHGRVQGLIELGTFNRRFTDQDFELAQQLAKRVSLVIANVKLYEKAKSAIQARDNFLSVASHELKTPTTALKIHLQMANETVKPEFHVKITRENLIRSLDVSIKQVNRLNSLFEDLLDVSRIEAGKLVLRFSSVNLSEMVSDIAERFQEQLALNNMDLNLEVDSDVVGFWDQTRIEQVIVNLISNAIKYAPGKPIRVYLKKTGQDLVSLIVEDFGPGIPKEKHAEIFQRFSRANASRSVSGLGLGLFIVMEIVNAHHGSIRVESKLGSGSRFIVDLPTAQSAVQGYEATANFRDASI